MRHSRSVVVVASTIVAGLVLTPHAQRAETPAQQPSFRSRADLVPVDVSVLDHDRRPVRGLTSADFTLVVDGKPRPITAFVEIDIPAEGLSAGTAPWVRDAPRDMTANGLSGDGRLVVILMDGTIPNGAPMVAAKRIARAAIDQLGPDDLAAVVRSSVFSDNGRSQGFTNDHTRLRAAVDSPFMGTTDPPDMTPNGLVSPSAVLPSLFQTQMQCEVIWNITRAMRDAPRRRKVLLFVGSRMATGGEITIGGERRRCGQVMLEALVGANVAVHVVDPVGVLTGSVAAEYLGPVTTGLVQRWGLQNQVRLDDLRMLPRLTGGRAVLNTNTPETMLPALFEESQTYYLLGFDPLPLAREKPGHTIRVEVKRHGVTVRSRTSYGMSDDGEDESRTSRSSSASNTLPPELAAALTGPLAVQRLPLSVTAASFATPSAHTAAVAIALDASLPAGPPPHRLTMTVAAFDTRGRGVAVRSQVFEISSQPAAAGRATEGLLARLNLPPGSYELRVAAQDEAGTIGSVFTFVDVPDFSRPTLLASSVLLHYAQGPPVAGNPVADLIPVVPTVDRVLTPGDKVSAFMRVYHPADAQPLSVTARVVDAHDRTIVEQPVDLAGAQVTDATDIDLPLPLSQLEPGHYLLTITISRGPMRAERQVRFEISTHASR